VSIAQQIVHLIGVHRAVDHLMQMVLR